MRILSIVIAFISIIVLVGCSNSSKPNPSIEAENSQESGVSTSTKTIETEVSDSEKISDFSIYKNDKYVSLKDWDNEIDLKEILGNPISEKKVVLGDGADTHTGSYIKTLLYDGLEIKMFSPKQNGINFWILSMKITTKGYPTTKNIIIGDSVEELRESYPNIKIAEDGRTDPNNCAYMLSNDDYNNLVFDIKDGAIIEISIYHEIP